MNVALGPLTVWDFKDKPQNRKSHAIAVFIGLLLKAGKPRLYKRYDPIKIIKEQEE